MHERMPEYSSSDGEEETPCDSDIHGSTTKDSSSEADQSEADQSEADQSEADQSETDQSKVDQSETDQGEVELYSFYVENFRMNLSQSEDIQKNLEANEGASAEKSDIKPVEAKDINATKNNASNHSPGIKFVLDDSQLLESTEGAKSHSRALAIAETWRIWQRMNEEVHQNGLSKKARKKRERGGGTHIGTAFIERS